MARKPKQKIKTSKVDARVPDRVAYAAEIAARRAGISRSSWIYQAMQRELTADGIDRKEEGVSLLDRLWSQSPAERLFRLAAELPDLLTEEEAAVVNLVLKAPRLWSPGPPPDWMWENGHFHPDYMVFRGGVLDLDSLRFLYDFILKVVRQEVPAPDWDAVFKEIDAQEPCEPARAEDFT